MSLSKRNVDLCRSFASSVQKVLDLEGNTLFHLLSVDSFAFSCRNQDIHWASERPTMLQRSLCSPLRCSSYIPKRLFPHPKLALRTLCPPQEQARLFHLKSPLYSPEKNDDATTSQPTDFVTSDEHQAPPETPEGSQGNEVESLKREIINLKVLYCTLLRLAPILGINALSSCRINTFVRLPTPEIFKTELNAMSPRLETLLYLDLRRTWSIPLTISIVH